MLAFIPSPHTGTLTLGPVTIHMYGLILLVAIAACVWLTGVRWVARGGDWDLVLRVAVWGVAFGIIGARAYHDITSWNEVTTPKWKGIFAVWEGGLGVWGGILLGCLAGAFVVYRSGARVRDFMDAVAPGLLLAQGIGRFGNWFNQELYGKPTDLPWGLEDRPRAPRRGLREPRDLPADLPLRVHLRRRSAWSRCSCSTGASASSRPRCSRSTSRSTRFGRFFEELLRIDPAHHFAGLRLNAWVSIVVFVCSTGFFVWWQFLRRGEGESAPRAAEPPRARRPGDGDPEGPRPAVSLGCAACSCGSSSSTSTPSRGRSTCF